MRRMAWKAVETIPIRIDGRISPERAHAVRAALLPRVFPVTRIIDGRAEPLATGSLVTDGDTHALLTAAHVFDRATVGDLAIPLPNDGSWAFLRSTRSRVFVHPERDIAFIMLEDPAFVRRLQTNWKSVPATHLRADPAADRKTSLYVMAGYPASQSRRIDGAVYMKPVVVFTGALDEGRLAYARTAERVDGLAIHTPELDGVSGALVWAVHDDEPDADCLLRAAAVQVGFAHSQHLRTESLEPARLLLGRLR
jgi:hypothetical protein